MKLLSLRYQFLEKELKNLGVEVLHYNYGNILKKRPIDPSPFLKFVKESAPDILWIQKDVFLTPEILHFINKRCTNTKIVMWYGDQRGYVIPPLVKQRAKYLHGLLITNEDQKQIDMYRNEGIPHVRTFYHSFSTEEFQLWPIKPVHEVFFGGSNFKSGNRFPLSPLRSQLLRAINAKYNLVVHGNGWPFPTRPWLLRNHYAKGLRTAHMNIGINHYDIQLYLNRRLFECVASGRLHLTYYIPGMEKLFINNRHLVCFNSVEQCIDLIKYFLKHPKKRENIAATGRNFFINNHSWPVRAKQLFAILRTI